MSTTWHIEIELEVDSYHYSHLDKDKITFDLSLFQDASSQSSTPKLNEVSFDHSAS